MLDLGDFTIGNVRIDRDLRRGRNRSGNYGACDGGDIGNVDVVGNVDNFGDARNFGDVGNVRLGLKQHRLFFDSRVDVADNAGRRASNRDSLGVY
jgi:hypothetical protein